MEDNRGKKQAKILRLGGAQNDRWQTHGRGEKAQSLWESVIGAIFVQEFKELRIACYGLSSRPLRKGEPMRRRLGRCANRP